MNDQHLDQLLTQARLAQARLDFSAREFGFETRLQAALRSRSCPPGFGSLTQLIRAVGGCAALTGVLAVWFLFTQGTLQTEDALAAYWDSGQAAYALELLV